MSFEYELADQDGYHFRAIEIWPADQPPDPSGQQISDASDAYRSHLTITFDQEDPRRG